MSKPRDLRDYLQDILQSTSNIREFTQGMTREQFLEDKKNKDAVIRNLEIIGEAANKILQDVRDQYPQIPWSEIIAMRDKLIHEYFGTDFKIVWQTLHEDLIPLELAVNKMVGDLYG